VRPSARRRRLLGILLSLALATTACVSGSGPNNPEAAKSASPVKPKVKGKKVNRQKPQPKASRKGSSPSKRNVQAGPPSAAPGPIARAVPQIPSQRATRTVTRVRTITVTAAALPVITLGPTEGDNSLSYEWDESSTSFVSAASSRQVIRGARVELLTELSSEPGAIAVHVTLRNLTTHMRVAVRGRMTHEVFGSAGLVARFVSDSIDTVLNPNGSTTVGFTYLLPTGQYTTRSAFEPGA
jgi:hypothetical protein